MRRSPAIRLLTLLAIVLVVATTVAGGVNELRECDCCGPMLSAPAAPVPPCCVGASDRRVAPPLVVHHGQPPAAGTHPMDTPRQVPSVPNASRGFPPGSDHTLYLHLSVLRI